MVALDASNAIELKDAQSRLNGLTSDPPEYQLSVYQERATASDATGEEKNALLEQEMSDPQSPLFRLR